MFEQLGPDSVCVYANRIPIFKVQIPVTHTIMKKLNNIKPLDISRLENNADPVEHIGLVGKALDWRSKGR